MASYQADWRLECKNIAEMHSEARRRNLFTDVKFSCGSEQKGGSSKIFHAHKLILACASPVFEGMFYGQMAEKENPISIPDDDPEAFEMLLRYAYGEDIPIRSFALAWKCYMIGDKYLMPMFQTITENYIAKTEMNEANFWETFENNIPLDSILQDKVDMFIQNNTESILKSEKFLCLTLVVVQYILQMDKLHTSEYYLLERVTEWAYNKYENNIQLKNLLSLFEHIRFSTLTSEEFCKFTDKFPVALDAKDNFQILKHLHNKSVYLLPDWCSRNNVMRNSFYAEPSHLYNSDSSNGFFD